MVARNGKEDEAKKLAREFYLKVAEVERAARQDDEGERVRDRADQRSHRRGGMSDLHGGKSAGSVRPAAERQEASAEPLPDRPEEPGARRPAPLARRVRSDVPERDARKWTRPAREAGAAEADRRRARAPADGRPQGARRTRARRHRGLQEGDAAAVPRRSTASRRPKEPSDLKVFVRGNPYTFGEDAPRGVSVDALARAAEAVHEGQRPAGAGRGDPQAADHRRGSSSIACGAGTWGAASSTRRATSAWSASGRRNPELLDYLASKFVADGMSWKKLHKDILMSRTYQLSATPVAANAAKDPDNRFFWRANRRRLEAEGVWDALLQASGTLDLAVIGGPSEDLTEKMTRRGVYATVSRLYPSDFQSTFDLPPATISAEKRYSTNVPQQRLFFLNSAFVHKQAEAIAERLKAAGDARGAGEEGVRARLPARADARRARAVGRVPRASRRTAARRRPQPRRRRPHGEEDASEPRRSCCRIRRSGRSAGRCSARTSSCSSTDRRETRAHVLQSHRQAR